MKSKAELTTCIFICLLINSQLDAGTHHLGFTEMKYFLQNTQLYFLNFIQFFNFHI